MVNSEASPAVSAYSNRLLSPEHGSFEQRVLSSIERHVMLGAEPDGRIALAVVLRKHGTLFKVTMLMLDSLDAPVTERTDEWFLNGLIELHELLDAATSNLHAYQLQ